MYDSDEEIKRKRRTLLIIIGIIVLIILLLVIFLLTRNSGKSNKDDDVVTNEIACVLEVKNGVAPDNNGTYHQPVEVGFKSITLPKKDVEIKKQKVGTSDNSRNKETFTASKTGTYHLYGYVQDSEGRKGKCEITVNVSLVTPSCELDVVQGTLGENGWYRSDVVVGFSSMDANNSALSIVKYYIEKEMQSLDTQEPVKAEQPSSNIEKYTVKDNLSTTLVGHVIDSAGNEGVCRLSVKKDSTVPTCKLKITSGTKNANGEYTDNPVIEMEEASDGVSEIAAQGVGISKNYSQKSFTVTAEGKTTVVGYVKDKAGNEGTCSLEIARPTSGGGGGGTTPTPVTPTQSISCRISLSVPDVPGYTSSGVYTQSVKATLTFTPSTGASITNYGIAETETYNQRQEITISNNGNHIVYGIVQDSSGKVARCSTPSFVVNTASLLYTKVKVGDYVNYNAGNWNETRSEKKIDGYYWGMQSGASKQTGVKCDRNDTSTRDGWMVFNVINNRVYLIHAGTPECIYHGKVSTTTVITTMQERAKQYVDGTYAIGSTILSCNLQGFNCQGSSYQDNLYKTGTHYWVAKPESNDRIMNISPTGSAQAYNLKSLGLRPIVILDEKVLTSGKSGNTWILK